jgi:hypothetical protein
MTGTAGRPPSACPEIRKLIQKNKEKKSVERAGKRHCVKIAVEHWNVATENTVKMLLVSTTSPLGCEKNEVIMVGCTNTDFHGWWKWYDFNGMTCLGINFNSKDPNGYSWNHIFKAKEDCKDPDGETHLLRGVNVNEAIVILVVPDPQVSQEPVTKESAQADYYTIESRALVHTRPDADVRFSTVLID